MDPFYHIIFIYKITIAVARTAIASILKVIDIKLR